MTKRLWVQTCIAYFSCAINLDQKQGSKNCEKLYWHCCTMCYNPTIERAEFQDGWLIKSSFLTTHNENESLSADQDQIPKKNEKNRIGNYPEVVESRVGESLSGDIF